MALSISHTEREALIARWEDDADAVGGSLTTLATCWECSKATIRIVGDSEQLRRHASYFYLNQFLLRGLLDATIIGIRRQLDTDKRTVSLVNFITELKAKADVYTLQDCIAAHLDRGRRMGFTGSDLDNYERRARSVYGFVSDTPSGLSARRIKKALQILGTAAKEIDMAADKYVAHQDRNAPDVSIPLHQIDSVMKVLYGIANQYLPIFNGGNSDAFGRIDTASWESMFTFPWKEA